MKQQYLHLSAYSCDKCAGPVVAGSIAERENEISQETGLRDVGAICLSCGDRPGGPSSSGRTLRFPPVPWGVGKIREAPESRDAARAQRTAAD
jgi:hypothetical protein